MKCLNLKKSNSKAKGINLQNIGDITRLNMERTNKLLGIEPFSNISIFHYFANQLEIKLKLILYIYHDKKI